MAHPAQYSKPLDYHPDNPHKPRKQKKHVNVPLKRKQHTGPTIPFAGSCHSLTACGAPLFSPLSFLQQRPEIELVASHMERNLMLICIQCDNAARTSVLAR